MSVMQGQNHSRRGVVRRANEKRRHPAGNALGLAGHLRLRTGQLSTQGRSLAALTSYLRSIVAKYAQFDYLKDGGS